MSSGETSSYKSQTVLGLRESKSSDRVCHAVGRAGNLGSLAGMIDVNRWVECAGTWPGCLSCQKQKLCAFVEPGGIDLDLSSIFPRLIDSYSTRSR